MAGSGRSPAAGPIHRRLRGAGRPGWADRRYDGLERMEGMSAFADQAALAARRRALAPACGPVRVVAVDGPRAAGKSTFATELAAALGGAPVVRSGGFPVPWDGDPLAWWPPLAAQVLLPLAAGRTGRFRRCGWRRGADAVGVRMR